MNVMAGRWKGGDHTYTSHTLSSYTPSGVESIFETSMASEELCLARKEENHMVIMVKEWNQTKPFFVAKFKKVDLSSVDWCVCVFFLSYKLAIPW